VRQQNGSFVVDSERSQEIAQEKAQAEAEDTERELALERLKAFEPKDFDAGEVLSDILKIMGVK
jgi:hypothetical protein